MLGFIVELRMCPHIPSCEHNALPPAVGKECVHVYFSGSVASWRPVLSVVIGQCVTITGLQRKLILVGPEKNEHFLFVATKSSLVSQLSTLGCVPMDCGGKEPCFRARERDPTTSGVTRATIQKELACDSKEGTCVATAFWQSSSQKTTCHPSADMLFEPKELDIDLLREVAFHRLSFFSSSSTTTSMMPSLFRCVSVGT